MGVEKMSVSFDLQLGAAIREAAAADDESISAWLADAARSRLRQLALARELAEFQAEFGAFTDEERAQADAVFDGAQRLHRDRGAA